MMTLLKFKYSLLYFGAIVVVSAAFNYYPLLVDLGGGASFSAWAFVVGFWFVLRDFSQRELGHLVLLPMGLGVVVAALMNQALAIATVISSSASELIDWLLYTWLKQPFHRRVLISSLISCPIDSIVFFAAFDFFQVIPGVNVFNWVSILAASGSKIIAALIIFWLHHNKKTQARIAIA